jgi:hypothetical protein
MGWGALKFLANNATNWDLEVIPAEVQAWISQEKDMEAAQKTGKWIVLKMHADVKVEIEQNVPDLLEVSL